MVCAALQNDTFKVAPEVRKNCVRVVYNEGYHVDVPSYRRLEHKDAWSGETSYSFELASSDWKVSDPREVTRWFKKTNNELSPNDGEGQFRRIVRCLKMFSKSRQSWKGKNPTGFALTKLTSEVFVSKPNRDDISLRDTMKAISQRLSWNKEIRHPVVNEVLIASDDPRPEYFRNRLDENLGHLDVLDAPECTHALAMAAWDKVFHSDWFSQQPPDDSDRGGGGGPKSPVDKRAGGTFANRT
jgi:hypothetical protein